MASVSVPAERPGGLLRRPHATTGFWSWFTTVDHKKIGILYGITAFVFFLIGGIEALLIRVQLARPDQTFLEPAVYNELFTMHGITMVFLVVMPLSAAFFNYLLPLMIGARDVAFPRLNAFSYWAFLFARAVHLLELVPGWRARTGAGSATRRTPSQTPVDRDDVLRDRAADRRDRVDGLGRELRRHDPEHAGAGHDACSGCRCSCGWRWWCSSCSPSPAGDHGRPGRAAVRPAVRDALLRRGRGRQPGAVAAPVLAVRAPRGVHPDPAGDGHRVRGPAGVRAQAAVRLPVRGVQRDRDRVHRVRRVGAPHVRGRPGTGGEHGVRGLDDDHRDPDRREDLQLARRRCGAATCASRRRCCSRSGSSRCS